MTTPRRWLTLSVDYVTTSYVAGTEMYVHRLNRALLAKGIDARASFYADGSVPTAVDGIPCHALPKPPDGRTRLEKFAHRPLGLADFERLLQQLQPSVVHFNAVGPFASLEHVRAARASGATVVATYHSPGFSCPSHALLYRRRTLCDGELRIGRCTRCCLAVAGLPLPAAALMGAVDLRALTKLVPPFLHHPLERRRGIAEYVERWQGWMEACHRITYAVDWIRDVLLRNGVPDSKLVYLPLPPPVIPEVSPRPDFWDWAKPGAYRLLYAGRVVDTKGTHVLVDAMHHHLAGENVALCIMGKPEVPSYGHDLESAAASDTRIHWYPFQPEAACLGAQLACDAVVVPSVSPETGPYSVLEAQWLGATIIGSERAGIAQLLQNYARGFLFRPSDPRALADAIRQAARARPGRIEFDRAEYVERFDRSLDALLGCV